MLVFFEASNVPSFVFRNLISYRIISSIVFVLYINHDVIGLDFLMLNKDVHKKDSKKNYTLENWIIILGIFLRWGLICTTTNIKGSIVFFYNIIMNSIFFNLFSLLLTLRKKTPWNICYHHHSLLSCLSLWLFFPSSSAPGLSVRILFFNIIISFCDRHHQFSLIMTRY